ncbi:MAG: glycogen synthase [Balneolaceae bacterium]
MNITYVSAECYPAAKAGGLGDVVGSLPKALMEQGHEAVVVIPKYETDWIVAAQTETIFEGKVPVGVERYSFSIDRVTNPDLGFTFLLVDLPGLFDRKGVYIDPWSGYAYKDERTRFFTFQIAVLEWLTSAENKPDVVHCNDHHTALIPFMMSECHRYEVFRSTPTVLTIHNGEYQGQYDMNTYADLPVFDLSRIGLLEWDGRLNSLAAGIKTAWQVTTVSEGYMQELLQDCHGLEQLLQQEQQKTRGIVNGIDNGVWDPATDPYLPHHYSKKTVTAGKKKNKQALCSMFEFDPDRPLISFIGRLVLEKGADLIPGMVRRFHDQQIAASFLVLGTGSPSLHDIFEQLNRQMEGLFNSRLEYNEGLAHRIYAGSDYLMMPSRVEPCGLNQMYAMRYGTIPIVRAVGGLADTVTDIATDGGYGFAFDHATVDDFEHTMQRAVDYYGKKTLFKKTQKQIMSLDFSWRASVNQYIELYQELKSKA